MAILHPALSSFVDQHEESVPLRKSKTPQLWPVSPILITWESLWQGAGGITQPAMLLLNFILFYIYVFFYVCVQLYMYSGVCGCMCQDSWSLSPRDPHLYLPSPGIQVLSLSVAYVDSVDKIQAFVLVQQVFYQLSLSLAPSLNFKNYNIYVFYLFLP